MRYFTLEELGATSESQFHPGFLEKLDELRHQVASPFYITSGARSLLHNAKIDGSRKSFHIWDKPQWQGQKGCMAVDIKQLDPRFKVILVEAALMTGWSVGINDRHRFIHIDRRIDIGVPKAIFSY